MKVHIRKRKLRTGKSTLYLEIYSKGVRKLENLRLYLENTPRTKEQDKTTLILAEKIRIKRQHQINEGRFGFKTNAYHNITLDDWISKLYNENIGDYRTIRKQLLTYRKESPLLGEIDDSFLSGFRNYLINEALKTPRSKYRISKIRLRDTTQTEYYSKLITIMKKAFNKRLISEMPDMKIIQNAGSKHIFLTADEVRSLIETESANSMIKNVFLFMVFTGLRSSDVIKLGWDNIKNNVLQLSMIKTRGPVTLHLSEEALNHLPKDKVFNEVFFGFKNRNNTLIDLREWASSADIRTDLTFHTARHTFAMLQLSAGASEIEIKELLGHKSFRSTAIYAKLYQENLRKAGQRKLI